MDLKSIKKEFLKQTQKEPEKHYATTILKQEGFQRKQCNNCERYFWTTTENKNCGDAVCSGGFKFINSTPAKQKLTYTEIWKNFSQTLKKQGYEPIKRYPVAARWRDDTDFVQASIYNFQPGVVSGEVEPPAKKLTVPQPCLRFNDIDNVGITGAHYTGFVMIGQHAFVDKKEWDQDKYFEDWHNWFTKGMKIPKNEITYHEDVWGGGGNLGPCMEIFSRGLELGNQVYMKYKLTGQGQKQELNLKVLDMGMGQERNSWFTGATPTSYETTFPEIIKKIKPQTGITTNEQIIQKFLPYSSYLNTDETENLEKTWETIAKKINEDKKELQNQVLPLSAMYSIIEHLRTLLFAINDGVMPSNTSGGYNLRVILRRALQLNTKYNWNLDFDKIIELHAQTLKEQYPELKENLEEVKEIINVEKEKYAETTKKSTYIINHQLKDKKLDTETLINLYDSHGITPEQIKETLKSKLTIPDNFYGLVAEKHENEQQTKKETEQIDFGTETPTKALYFEDGERTKFKGKVIKIKNDLVLLEETYFFPTSGGQHYDTGNINGENVIEVYKQGALIIHKMKTAPKFKEGETINCEIDEERRKQLTQHHTATHIINKVCRNLLGNHVWQSGSGKFVKKARIDLTHYKRLDEETLKKIEQEANKIVKQNLKITKRFESKADAEKKYGFSIYQGGLIPGKNIRIVEIENYDVEACGGTHVNTTGEVGEIKIIGTKKLQEGIVRLEYVAGKALTEIKQEGEQQEKEIAQLLECEVNQIPGRVEELFKKWKDKVKKKKEIDIKLTSTKTYEGDVIKQAIQHLSVSKDQLKNTINRFLKDIQQ